MNRTRNPLIGAAVILASVVSLAPRAIAIPCSGAQGAAYCRSQWEAMYPNSAGNDLCWGDTSCVGGQCQYYTMNRCGSSNNTPDAQCCVPGIHDFCQNGDPTGCNNSCNAGYATCRGSDYSFGCPYSLNTDVNNCGSCNNVCPAVNGTAGCSGGQCSLTCSAGYAKCGTSACSFHTAVDVNNCGSCGNVCPVVNNALTSACNSGACAVGSCAAGWGDCDGAPDDGCEHNVGADTNNCGSCGNVCNAALAAHQVHTCASGSCGIACSTNFANCDSAAGNGCEVQLNSNDVNNCGSCGHACPACAGSPVCNAGVCGCSTCAAGTQTCGGGAACATLTNTDANNCGGCGMACSSMNVAPSCAAGLCNGTCTGGFADCNADKLSDGCEVNLASDVANCGACAHACNVAHAVQVCASGVCSYTQCASGYSDCDGNVANGCELQGTCPVAAPDMAGGPADLSGAPADMAVAEMDLSVPANGQDMTMPSPAPKTPPTAASGCDIGSGPMANESLLLVLLALVGWVTRRRMTRYQR